MVEVDYDVVDLPGWDFDELIGGAALKSALRALHVMTGEALDNFPAALLPLHHAPLDQRTGIYFRRQQT